MPATLAKKAAYLTLSWPPHAFGYAVVPVVVSWLGDRHGWHGHRPGVWNATGLPPLLAGAAVIVWAIVSHYRESPDEVDHLVPRYLATTGAYSRTRNPLYLGGITMWFGWALLFGSIPVVIGAVALAFGFDRFGVPYEERRLTRMFGATYATYCDHVPRWVARRVDRA